VTQAAPAASPGMVPSMTQSVTVVLVHRGRPRRCLDALAALDRQGVEVRPVVVDNGSPAADIEAIRAGAPAAEIVCLGANTGYGPAANVGLRRWLDGAGGDWVAVAPDDALPEPGCLATLLASVRDRPRAGIVSAEYGSGHEYAPTVDRVLGPYMRAVARSSGFEPADFGHGTLLCMRRACLEEIGLFDEEFFAYCEEADLGLRARAAGWDVGFVWGAVVANGDPSASAVRVYLELRNTLRLVEKHFGRGPARTRLRIARAVWLAGMLRRRHLSDAQRLAIADYRAGRFGSPPEVVTAVS
jgi:N-acetylglucosaminyl-diphospho-decaprenol L-rhamnosyltransferase